jgi:hypothetical protein
MKKIPVALTCLAISLPCFCFAQQTDSSLPDAPSAAVHGATPPAYSPPTQEQRFRSYLRQTYGLSSLVEAGARAGIDQARDHPSEWPEGAEGYGDRYGSAMGEIIVRETTEYMFADLFREDIRRVPCRRPCSQSKFKLAFEDSFLARRGDDGHESVSFARLIGPFSGNIVATNTWYPAGTTKADSAKGVGLTYGLVYVRNLIHEFIAH